jgi:hypothetical protein
MRKKDALSQPLRGIRISPDTLFGADVNVFSRSSFSFFFLDLCALFLVHVRTSSHAHTPLLNVCICAVPNYTQLRISPSAYFQRHGCQGVFCLPLVSRSSFLSLVLSILVSNKIVIKEKQQTHIHTQQQQQQQQEIHASACLFFYARALIHFYFCVSSACVSAWGRLSFKRHLAVSVFSLSVFKLYHLV